MLKLEHILIILGCFLTGIYTQDQNCRLIDFNKIDSISLMIEPCSSGNQFTVKSFQNEPVTPYRENSENYLSNDQSGITCFSTIESFTLDENTEFYSAVYLRSIVVDDSSFVEIQVIDDDGNVSIITRGVVTRGWNELYGTFDRYLENVKIELRADVTTEAVLAIEYLHIGNTVIEEPECRRGAETTVETEPTETTTETTSEIPTETTSEITAETTSEITTEPTSEITIEPTSEITTTTGIITTSQPNPIDSNDNSVWTILSFVFILTTVVVIAVSIYLIYLYKTTLAMNKILSVSAAQLTSTSLPRLTVTTSSHGDHVIVGIEKVKYI